MPVCCRQGKRPMGRVRPRQPRPEHHQLRQGNGGNGGDGTKANTLNGFLETQKIFQQSKQFYDALKSVHDVVKGGVKVGKSIALVAEISEIYVRNFQNMLADPNFTADELAAISSGYAMLLDESSDVLQDLKNVVNVTGMSLSDAERLAVIDRAYNSLMNTTPARTSRCPTCGRRRRTTPTGCWLSTARRMNATGNMQQSVCLCY